MNRAIKTLFTVIFALAVLILVVGILLPSSYTVERSVVIEASPDEVHKYVGDLKKWEEWTPWKEDDPTIVVTYGEETKGVGASQYWVGDSGTGSLTFTKDSPEEGVEYDLTFDGGAYECKSAMKYNPLSGNETKVTWTMAGDMGQSIVGGYLVLMMDSMVGGMFDKGLSNLKNKVEQNKQ